MVKHTKTIKQTTKEILNLLKYSEYYIKVYLITLKNQRR